MQLPPSATLADSQILLSLLGKALGGNSEASGPVEVDASGLRHFDTSTIALLMQARRLAQQAGRAFSVHGVPDKLVQLAQLYGVEELLSLPPEGPSVGPSLGPSVVPSAGRSEGLSKASTVSGPDSAGT